MANRIRKPNIKLLTERLKPGLSEEERNFMTAAELGDDDIVKNLLSGGRVSVDRTDTQGRTVLDVAIESGQEELVSFLIAKVSHKTIHQGLLCAVENDRAEICEILLNHPIYQTTISQETEIKCTAELIVSPEEDRLRVPEEDSLRISRDDRTRLPRENGLRIPRDDGLRIRREDGLRVPRDDGLRVPRDDVERIQKEDGVRVPREEGLRVHKEDGSLSSKTSQMPCTNLEHMLKEALIKASIKNNFQIVRMIILKGAVLEMPHDYFCSCDECISEQEKDYMVFCNKRLDTFRALASPAYLALTEHDPIIASFRLSNKFSRLEVVETEHKNTYRELNDQVQEFTLELINQCRTSNEVRRILDSPREPSALEEEEENTAMFPLLSVALDMDQKKFVAHPKCQAQVSALWFSGLQKLRHLNRFEVLLMAIPLGMIVLPILSVVYIVAPWSKITLLLDTPSTRFLSYTCSYISFLALVIVGKLQFSNIWLSMGCEETESYAYVIIILIFLWIIGWIWEEMKQVFEAGAVDYFRSIWNVVDSLMLTFLLSSFTLDVVVPMRISRALKESPIPFNVSGETVMISMIPTCYTLMDGSGYFSHEATCGGATIALYAEWTPTWAPDPELISDIMFSVGIILSIARISFIMPANETFGTMLVSFRRTFGDLIKLFAMFLLILVSFSCGLAALYAAHQCQTLHFGGFRNTMFLLVWSLFGFGPGEAPDLNSDQPMSSLTNNSSRNGATVAFGYIIYGLYVFAALVVLMNLLIAVMSNTFQEVQDDRDVEWKFARTELWMTFIEPACPVAPPFNLIPTPKSICGVYRSFRSFVLSLCSKERIQLHRNKAFRHERKHPKRKRREDVICTLIRRYIEYAQREMTEGDENATEDKLRRLIERVSSKTEKRLTELQGQLKGVENHVHNVQKGGNEIKTMQDTEIELTQKLIDTQEQYQKLLKQRWQEGFKFREDRLQQIQSMREERRELLEKKKFMEALEMEDKIADVLEDADFIPKTTI
ncbi:hypothetical protein FSP39_023931 [Pinctada imbricata]|uniref:Transient receptor ion channel domain-containing protein n=1 Tax=Pinctada imbricata TaxID=66713 RepID=A0AA89C9D9_PINIB|nr:hypothetical protein FSP39_023931 [Pinctada imbricata]